MSADIYEIGWWITSAEEVLYGPASRETIRRFLVEGAISANTLIRHCTQKEARPVADQQGMIEGDVPREKGRAVGDRLAEVWPYWRKQRLKLAEGSLPCSRHGRPAILVCLRCQAPYCQKCQQKPHKRPFYFCRKCQANVYNRRAVAIIADNLLFYAFLYVPGVVLLTAAGTEEGTATAIIYLLALVGALWLVLHDVVFRGAGPGKRMAGLSVVSSRDGVSHLSYGQAVLRWLGQAIPFFNLIDLSVPFRDPLMRRYGDRWAGTRVIDTPGALVKARAQARSRLAMKGVELAPVKLMTMSQFAQIAE
jgi:uncharacterized RDD family membrane protein YckC